MSECTEARFLADVKLHSMTVLRDEGVFRHVRFRAGDSVIMGFDLITWPGHLCYTGDMGTYVFARVRDMFEFFRLSPKELLRGTLYINQGYWSEKVLAADKNGKIRKFDIEKAKRRVREIADEGEFCADDRVALEEAIRDAEENEHDFRRAIEELRSEADGGELFTDFWEIDLQEFTYSFTWCCYAIAWGIKQYDLQKAGARVETVA